MKAPRLPECSTWWLSGMAVALLLALTAAAYLAVVRPALHRARAHRVLTEQVAALRHRGAEQAKVCRQLQQTLARRRSELQRCDVQLQPAGRINQRLSLLAGFAQQHGLALDAMRPGPPTIRPYFLTVPITCETRCTYRQAATFFHALVERMSDMAVRSFRFTASDNDGDGRGLLRVELLWYTAPPDQAPAGPAAPNASPLLTEATAP